MLAARSIFGISTFNKLTTPEQVEALHDDIISGTKTHPFEQDDLIFNMEGSAIRTPPPALKRGDRVTIEDAASPWHGQSGVIWAIERLLATGEWEVRVSFGPEGAPYLRYFGLAQLVVH